MKEQCGRSWLPSQNHVLESDFEWTWWQIRYSYLRRESVISAQQLCWHVTFKEHVSPNCCRNVIDSAMFMEKTRRWIESIKSVPAFLFFTKTLASSQVNHYIAHWSLLTGLVWLRCDKRVIEATSKWYWHLKTTFLTSKCSYSQHTSSTGIASDSTCLVFCCIWPAIKCLSCHSLPEAKLAHKQQSMSTISRPSPLSDWVRLTFNLPFSSISLVALGVSNNVPVTNHFTSKSGHPKPLWLAYYINNDKERHFGVVRLIQRRTKAIGCS